MTTTVYKTTADVNAVAVSELFSLPNPDEDILAARDEAVASATIAKVAAGISGATIFATYSSAFLGAQSLPDGAYANVLIDETRNGQQSIYFVDQPDPVTVDFDFDNDTYSLGTTVLQLDYVRSVALNIVAVPAISSSAGLVGDVAIDSTHLYVAVGLNTWKRIALESF